jgi:hypothetical protein
MLSGARRVRSCLIFKVPAQALSQVSDRFSVVVSALPEAVVVAAPEAD